MCGVAGLISYYHEPLDKERVIAMCDYMHARGPDNVGYYTSPNNHVVLGHRRLSIQDLSDHANQPMVDHFGHCCIVFNGEIYNAPALRQSLIKQGYHFKTHSDTEVILNLYLAYGDQMFSYLNGMYAFGIYDHRVNRLLLGRDPFGIKPLYYYDDGRHVWFASQVKAIKVAANLPSIFEPAAEVGFFLMGSVPSPWTIYPGVFSLPAGSYLWVDQRGLGDIQTHFDLSTAFDQAVDNQSPMVTLPNALRESVASHLISDVPVGLFLSAGLDSSILLRLMQSIHQKPVNTITLGFDRFRGTKRDETIYAEQFAKDSGSQHQTVWMSDDAMRSMQVDFFKAMDQPTIDGVNSFLVSAAAKSQGLKVALSGVGADELLGGYDTFSVIPKLVHYFYYMSKFRIGTPVRKLLSPIMSAKYASLIEYGGSYSSAYVLKRGLSLPWQLGYYLSNKTIKEGLEKIESIIWQVADAHKGGVYRVIAEQEMRLYMRHQLLRDTDWASMAHSIEVRTPFIDKQLFNALMPSLLRHPVTKRERYRQAFSGLPKQMIDKPKTGFFVPYDVMLPELKRSKQRMTMSQWAQHVYDCYRETA